MMPCPATIVWCLYLCVVVSARSVFPGAVAPVRSQINGSNPDTYGAGEKITSSNNGTQPPVDHIKPQDIRKVLSTESAGMEAAHFSVDAALNRALLQANSSLSKLNRLFSPHAGFAQYMEELQHNATVELHNSVDLASGLSPNSLNPAILRLSDRELSSRLFARMTPLFKRQVALLKQEVTIAFNKRIADDTPITVHILEDLQQAKVETLHNFTSLVKQITPKDAPVSLWNADYEAYELDQVMTEYIEGLEYSYRAQGVLPRYGGSSGASPNAIRLGPLVLEPPPTEVSVHVLASHPLGRDHRQDPLGMRPTDKLQYSPKRKLTPPAPAAGLRAELKCRVADLDARSRTGSLPTRIAGALHRAGIPFPSVLRREARRSEFAREMMMLPLSLKSPDLSAAGGGAGAGAVSGRGARGLLSRRNVKGSQGDSTSGGAVTERDVALRAKEGPER
jgi:hypothetical protein